MITSRNIARKIISMYRHGDDISPILESLKNNDSLVVKNMIPSILSYLERSLSQEKRLQDTIIITARKVVSDVAGKKIETYIDPSLIGGFIQMQNGMMKDASIDTVISNLQNNLSHS